MRWQDEEGQIHENCVVFQKVREEYGELSNMSSELPLHINGVRIPSSEALYQACKFPDHADWQREIIDEPSPMAAKMKAKKDGRGRHHARPDWKDVTLDVMRWVLRVKLAQHYRRIAGLLRSTRDRAIVEKSARDDFWGAIPEKNDLLIGTNHLGMLWMEMRELVSTQTQEELATVPSLEIPNFLLFGSPITEVRARG